MGEPEAPLTPPASGPASRGRAVPRWLLPVVASALAAAALVVLVPRRTRAPCGPAIPPAESSFVGGTRLGKGEALAEALARYGLGPDCVNRVYAALAKTDFNFRGMKPGDSVTFDYRGLSLAGVTYHKDLAVGYRVSLDSAGATASKESKPIDTLRAVIRGTIKGSLWSSLTGMGESPGLVVEFANILGYEIDFLTECSQGDTFEILVDRYYVDSVPYNDGRMLAVHYRGAPGDFYGYYFRTAKGHWDYYNGKGQSLRKTVLRSPLNYARVTSYFGGRRHPITRRYRQHAGVDYGAPTGTPVSCIADGTVVMARWNGGYGKFVQVRHSGGLVSCYGHLSSFGAGVSSGRRVRQGQIVGRVGSTGFSTGPHLHFEIRQGGRPVNPLKVIPPRAEPVPKSLMGEFERVKAACLEDLKRPAGPIRPPDSIPDSAATR